jgi:hypothetical protein
MMANRIFAERLNKALDSIGMPCYYQDRTNAFSRLTKLPKFKAQVLLSGTIIPDDGILELLSRELEVSKDWLLGVNTTH